MTYTNDPFGDSIAQKARDLAAAQKARKSISVAVLGPGLSELGVTETVGSKKRRQIRDALVRDGHRPFFPEEFVDPGSPPILRLTWEASFLRNPDIDLIVILHTSTSVGVIAELGHFVDIPEIIAKTVVLYPQDYYTPDSSLAANTVQGYYYRTFYPETHLESCQIVSECRHWANVVATDRLPKVSSFVV